MRNRAYRRWINNQKEKRLRYIITVELAHTYHPNAGYICEDTGYVQYPRDSRNQKSSKRLTNRKARHTVLPRKGNAYRKCCEYHRH